MVALYTIMAKKIIQIVTIILVITLAIFTVVNFSILYENIKVNNSTKKTNKTTNNITTETNNLSLAYNEEEPFNLFNMDKYINREGKFAFYKKETNSLKLSCDFQKQSDNKYPFKDIIFEESANYYFTFDYSQNYTYKIIGTADDNYPRLSVYYEDTTKNTVFYMKENKIFLPSKGSKITLISIWIDAYVKYTGVFEIQNVMFYKAESKEDIRNYQPYGGWEFSSGSNENGVRVNFNLENDLKWNNTTRYHELDLSGFPAGMYNFYKPPFATFGIDFFDKDNRVMSESKRFAGDHNDLTFSCTFPKNAYKITLFVLNDYVFTFKADWRMYSTAKMIPNNYTESFDKGYSQGEYLGESNATKSWNNMLPSLFGSFSGFFKDITSIKLWNISLSSILVTFSVVLLAVFLIRLVMSK